MSRSEVEVGNVTEVQEERGREETRVQPKKRAKSKETRGETSVSADTVEAFNTRLAKVELAMGEVFDTLDSWEEEQENRNEEIKELEGRLQGVFNSFIDSMNKSMEEFCSTIRGEIMSLKEELCEVKRDLTLSKAVLAVGASTSATPKDIFARLFISCWGFLALKLVNGGPLTSYAVRSAPPTFDVMTFGAVGDGKADDAKAFMAAWKAACNRRTNRPKVIVPQGKTYLVNQIQFGGPCKSPSIKFEILGTIVAPPKSAWTSKNQNYWLSFYLINGLNVVGNEIGVVDGQGSSWWATFVSSFVLSFAYLN
ncbi:unnamed protein product [Fraxinus pennsylvanica]|uniref:Polygalacturonase n=1 Tax=Fraxinus pennsylvanica TaxID=56036 RepID=A0AAD2DH24_9LAMI|nr:unnamed protein product [Fraxinus pennsylvanica]